MEFVGEKKIMNMITNDVSDYINLWVRIAHIICNHPVYFANKLWI
jgi:hypothetical protein